MKIQVMDSYHRLRIEELELTADYLAKTAEEKERVREERSQLREEDAGANTSGSRSGCARNSRTTKPRSPRCGKGRRRRRGQGGGQAGRDPDAIQGINRRAANVQAGHVYVISNVGAFGPSMVKIGMTRRLDHSTGSASSATPPFPSATTCTP